MRTLWGLGVAMDFSLGPSIPLMQMRRALVEHHSGPTRSPPDVDHADPRDAGPAGCGRAQSDPKPAR